MGGWKGQDGQDGNDVVAETDRVSRPSTLRMGLTDFRHAIRLLRRSPIFTVTAVASLAIGLAASAAIYSLADALLFARTRGVRDAGQIVDIGRSTDGVGFDNMSHPIYEYLRDHATTLTGMSAVEFSGSPMSLVQDGGSERVTGVLVSASYFDLLGTHPAIGRFFRPDEDDVPGQRPAAVLSHAFWQRRFGGDPRILEKPIRLNNQDFSVVGVSEPGFEGLTFIGTDLWVPMAMVATVRGRDDASILDAPGASWHMAVGRLNEGVDPAQAQAELNTLIAAFKAEEPRVNRRHQIVVAPTSRIPAPVRTAFLGFIGLLFAFTAALMAIACSNVAGMLLARAAARRREMATRLAVGASRRQLIAQLLTETLVLFLAAGMAALPLTFWLTRGLTRFLPAMPVDVRLELAVSPRVVVFMMGMALVTAVIFGLAPARHALASDLTESLRGTCVTPDRRRLTLRNALVVAQVALSLTLVVTASLFVRTLQRVAQTDPGYVFANVELASLDISTAGYRGAAAAALVERLQDRLSAISGVTAVSAARLIPLQGSRFGLGALRVEGYAGAKGDGTIDASWNVISPRYFEVLGTRLIDGRDFGGADRGTAPRVAIVNDSFARTAWPGRRAVGQRVIHRTAEGAEQAIEIVGVVSDAKYRYFSDPPAPFVFVPLSQQPTGDVTLFVKHAEGRSIAREIRAAVAQVEPGVPVILLQSFEDAAAVGLLPQRLAAWIAGSVGIVGIFLAALGLYGLMAFLVAQRTRDIAIRMALGASHAEIMTMVLKQAARLGLAGAAIGFAFAAASSQLARSLLIGVPLIDPVAFGGTALLFVLVLGAACWTPTARAASIDPAEALRAE